MADVPVRLLEWTLPPALLPPSVVVASKDGHGTEQTVLWKTSEGQEENGALSSTRARERLQGGPTFMKTSSA